MAKKEHRYSHELTWTGNTGSGTAAYRSYERAHTIRAEGKPDILGSSDPAFRGDPSRYNPEDLFVSSISACHMLWYLGLCASAGVTVTAYTDQAEGVMVEDDDGAGRFTSVTLRPRIQVAAGTDVNLAERLHHQAHEKCFIANSINVPVAVEGEISMEESANDGSRVPLQA